MSKTKQLFKETSIYLILGFLPMGINFIMAPIYSYYLSPQEYGIIGIADMVGGFAGVFIAFGIKQAFARYYFDFLNDKRQVYSLLTTAYASLLFFTALFVTIGFFIGDIFFRWALSSDAFTFNKYGIAVIGSVCFTLLNEILLSFYRNEEKPRDYGIFSLGFFLFSLVGIITGVVVLKLGAYGNIWGRMLGGAMFTLFSLVYVVKQFGFSFRFLLWKKMAVYGLPLVPYSLFLFVYHKTDMYWIERFFSLSQLGLYAFGMQISAVFSVLIYALFNAISPKIYRFLSQTGEYSREFILKLNTLFSMSIFFFLFLGILAIYPIFTWLIDEAYGNVLEFLPYLFMLYIPHMFYVILSVPIFYFKKTAYLPGIIIITELFFLLFLWLLHPVLGMKGVALAAIAGRCVQVITTILAIHFMGKTQSLNFEIRKNALFAIAVLGLTMLIFNEHTIVLVYWQKTIAFFVAVNLLMLLIYKKELRWGLNNLKNLL